MLWLWLQILCVFFFIVRVNRKQFRFIAKFMFDRINSHMKNWKKKHENISKKHDFSFREMEMAIRNNTHTVERKCPDAHLLLWLSIHRMALRITFAIIQYCEIEYTQTQHASIYANYVISFIFFMTRRIRHCCTIFNNNIFCKHI